jgi:hypothetical protein
LGAALGSMPAGATGVPSWWSPELPPNVIEDRFRLEVNVFYPNFDTQIRADPSLTVAGTRISAEDDLGLEKTKVLADVELTLLPGEHHLLRLSGFEIRRAADVVLNKRIVFDDQTYNVNDRVRSNINLTLIGLTYGYRFIVKDRGELTGTFGLSVAQLNANAVALTRIREPEEGAAPVPFLGLEGRFNFTKRWGVEGRGGYLTVNVGDVKGTITDARGALTWRWNPHFVFGLGYRSFGVHVKSRSENTPGVLDMTMSGPMVFMRGSL